MKYSNIMPDEYKLLVYKLDFLFDYTTFPLNKFQKSMLKEEHGKLTEVLFKLTYYFDDLDKGAVAANKEKDYGGWGFISFLSIAFLILCCFIVFCIYLYELK
ncbi:hypothetical protein [Lysinibacillus xylanilyticus]|uniref:hypothetical protein n=1 Tax=Lysinibacillus xylanilyticus TaxID=582475 RepID=UPI003CFD24CC